ncbi:MAG: hypothetical protein JWQ17_211, partial [Tardiphaga sp.]|nr:hypothetical protein [Tardiphaga sp.]
MVQRSPSYIKVARRRFRCMVKVAVPTPYGMGMSASFFEEELVRLFGKDGYKIIPADWNGALQAIAVMFDDADQAPAV